jgi:hypothetical protein
VYAGQLRQRRAEPVQQLIRRAASSNPLPVVQIQ